MHQQLILNKVGSKQNLYLPNDNHCYELSTDGVMGPKYKLNETGEFYPLLLLIRKK